MKQKTVAIIIAFAAAGALAVGAFMVEKSKSDAVKAELEAFHKESRARGDAKREAKEAELLDLQLKEARRRAKEARR